MPECPPFRQADKTLDDVRLLQVEPQLPQRGMLQQVIDRPLPVACDKIRKERFVIYRQVIPFAKSYFISQLPVVQTPDRGQFTQDDFKLTYRRLLSAEQRFQCIVHNIKN